MIKKPDITLGTRSNLRSGEKIIPTLCHGCGGATPFCAVLCHVVDGKFVRVEGNPDAFNNWGEGCTSLCVKGNTGPQLVYAPNRLKYPMKRAGAKGEGKFKRITWDEALDTVADKLKETKAKYGAESYGVLSGWSWPNRLGSRFLNVHGSPNFLHSAICVSQRMEACRTTIGFMSWAPGDWNKTRLIINWGANCENSGVNTGTPFAILNALQNGAILIDIRPMQDTLGAKADLWLPVRPGTDCALALAMLNVLIKERLYDAEFVEHWCHGFDRLTAHVEKYDPEWAEKATGLPADKIRLAARLIGTIKPSFIMIGNGVGDQTRDGTATISAICLISAITSNLDVPGGQIPGSPGLPQVGPPLIKINEISELSEVAPPDMVDKQIAPEAPTWYQKLGLMPHGLTSAYYKALMSTLTGKPYPLRVLNASCSNPLSATRNPKKVAEALNKLDFMFAADIYHAPHIDYADIVLPACTSYEHSDQIAIRNAKEGTWIGIYNKVVDPLGEARSDWQIYLDLATRMGYGEYFWDGDMDACLCEQLAPSGITLEELRASPRGIFIKRTEVPPPRQYRSYSQLFKNLPHGKVQCYNELLGGKDSCDSTIKLDYFPIYLGPPEGIAETPELVKEYPFALSDVHAYRFCRLATSRQNKTPQQDNSQRKYK